jgi:hypothetical protein
MKKHLWDIAFYAVIFGIVYYQTSHDSDWMLMGIATVFFISFVNIASTVIMILFHSVLWFWDQTVNYSKNRKVYESEE